MGLLDDAIREHLDLKRRRGADPTEVERAEREALGPVRRDPFEQADDELDAGAGELAYDQAVDEARSEPEVAMAHDANGDWGDLFDEEHAPGAGAHAERIAEDPADPIALEPEPLEEEPPALEDLEGETGAPHPGDAEHPAPHPADAEHPAPYPPDSTAGEETVEYDVEHAIANEPRHSEPEPAHGEPAAPEDDVLEETPEFLQDTPDHDRLWFEQRPPRDFDFDG